MSIKGIIKRLSTISSSAQSLAELMVTLAVFVILISVTTSVVMQSYLSNRAGRETTLATQLAQEGIEATKSIKDEDFNNLVDGEHGLAVVSGKWTFSGTEDNLGDVLNQGNRKIIIDSVQSGVKKITSQVTWNLTPARTKQVKLVTYLADWKKAVGNCTGTPVVCSNYLTEAACLGQVGCNWNGSCSGTPDSCSGFVHFVSCQAQDGCFWQP